MPWTEGVVRRVLPNGLTLLVERNDTAPVVAVVTHVRAGYFDEPDEWVGISHVLEHMFFKGTARRGPGAIARETQLLGGYINAGTIYDRTVYYTVLPSRAGGLERALDVQADALMHAALDPDELSRELEVIVQEAKRKLDSPPAVANETLYAQLFRVHRMRRWRIGTEAGLRRLTEADVRAYYATRYTPGRVIVGIVGDLDVARALRVAEETYGSWDRPAADVAGSPAEPEGAHAEAKVLQGDVERPIGIMGWRTVGTLHADAPALDVTASLLGIGRGSRLYRLVERPGIASHTAVHHYTPTEVGVFEMEAEADPGRIDDALRGMTSVVEGLRRDGPAEGELERVRALLATRWARRFESMEGRAAGFCQAEALGDYRFADELYRRLVAVEAGAVRRVAEQYLDPRRAAGVIYLRQGARTALSDGGWPPPVEVASVPSVRRPALPRPRRGPPARGRETLPGGIVHIEAPGADLLVRGKPGSGMVTVGLQFPGASADETPDRAGISWLTARAALQGAAGMDADQLAQTAERLGGALSAAVGRESLGWWLTVPAEAMDDAVTLLGLVARRPELDAGDVTVERERQLSDARSVRDDMLRYPLQRVLRQAFPDDPYGLPTIGEPESIAQLTVDRVREWAGTLSGYRPAVVAVGDLPSDRLADGVAPLGAWATAGAAAERPLVPPRWGGTRGDERRRKAQTAIAMAFPAAPYASAQRYPLLVLSSLLSGLAGRLFDELRERRSLAYTVTALPWLARRGGVVLTYIATSPDREDEAREAMLAELGRVVETPPDAAELERARNYAAGALELRKQSGRAVASEVLEGWIHGALEQVAETPDRVRAVTRDEVVGVAEMVFRVDERAEYVVRGTGESVTAAA